MTDTTREPISIKAPSPGKYRWLVMWLLFAAMVINYVDRQMIGVLKPTLSTEFGWSETDYADIVFWFQATYALFYAIWGRIMDRIGARFGLGIAFAIWQVGHIFHGAARDLSHFIMARMLLGVGEAGGFPGGIKAVTEWFPKKERALATGLFNAGTNIGAIVTPLLVPALVLAFGWQMAFVITGVAGPDLAADLAAGLSQARASRRSCRAAELAYIEQDPADPAEKVGWLKLLTVSARPGPIALGKFLIDPIWWMFLFWLPDFLGKRYGLDLKTFGPPLVAIYLMSDVGSVGGGWLSSRLMQARRAASTWPARSPC